MEIKQKKKKCKHDFTGIDGLPVDGGSCNKCGKTWIEIIEDELTPK